MLYFTYYHYIIFIAYIYIYIYISHTYNIYRQSDRWELWYDGSELVLDRKRSVRRYPQILCIVRKVTCWMAARWCMWGVVRCSGPLLVEDVLVIVSAGPAHSRTRACWFLLSGLRPGARGKAFPRVTHHQPSGIRTSPPTKPSRIDWPSSAVRHIYFMI